MSLVIGIDLGTTYCCAAICEEGDVRTIETQTSENTTPSHVAFDDDGNVSAGSAAKSNTHLKPENCLYDIKRMIGRKYDDPVLQKDKQLWPFEIVNNGNNSPLIKLTNGKIFCPEQISAKLLSFLKVQAEIFLSEKVAKAVITVPAYFNDGQRQATKDAAEIAGLEVLRIMNEPTAAAIAYYHQNKNLNGKTMLVFDLGGGTFDVSIVKINGTEIKVLGVGGDTHLGGEDFDVALVEYCLEEFKKIEGVDLKADLKSTDSSKRKNANNKIRRLKQQCEKTKIGLSTTRQMPVSLDAMHKDKPLHVVISREKFESLNKAYFDKCFEILKEVIKDAALDVKNIDEVILVGGSSKIPAIQARVTDFFGGKKPHRNIRGSEAVAYGAAIEASRMSSSSTPLNLNVKDVCPVSLGIEVTPKDGQTDTFSCILKKNTPIPCRNTKNFRTSKDNMMEEDIDVFEGESPLVKNNHYLGGFKLALPPKCPKWEPLTVTMELTAEGILHCTAICPRIGTSNQLKVIESKGRLTRTEILRMKKEEAVSARAFALL